MEITMKIVELPVMEKNGDKNKVIGYVHGHNRCDDWTDVETLRDTLGESYIVGCVNYAHDVRARAAFKSDIRAKKSPAERAIMALARLGIKITEEDIETLKDAKKNAQ